MAYTFKKHKVGICTMHIDTTLPQYLNKYFIKLFFFNENAMQTGKCTYNMNPQDSCAIKSKQKQLL